MYIFMFFTKKTAPLKIRNQKNPLKIWRNIKKILKSIGTCHWLQDLAMKAEVLKQAAELSVEAMALGWDGWANH